MPLYSIRNARDRYVKGGNAVHHCTRSLLVVSGRSASNELVLCIVFKLANGQLRFISLPTPPPATWSGTIPFPIEFPHQLRNETQRVINHYYTGVK